MLRSGSLLVLALVISAVSTFEDKSREKRQTFTSPSFGFPIGDNKETFFEFDGERLVQLTSVGGVTTSVVRIGEDDVFECDLGTGQVTSTSLPAISEGEIRQCINISVSPTGFEMGRFVPDNVVEFGGPGQLYLGPGMVLFIEDSASLISDFIEGQRAGFVPVIPPLDVEIVRRGDELVLNLDDQTAGEDAPPANTNDVLQLFGSDCRQVPVGQSVSYSGNLLRVRQGIREISRDEGIDELVSVLGQNVAGERCEVLTRNPDSRSGFLAGPGFLCVGDSASDMNERVAFFTDSPDTPEFILDTLVDAQLRCSEEGPSLVGDFTPNVNTVLVRLSGDEVSTFPAPSPLEKNAEGVLVRDRFGNVLEAFLCPGTGVTLALWIPTENRVTVLGPADTLDPVDAAPGGGTTVFNPDDCAVFAYPSAIAGITDLINSCRDSVVTTPPAPIVFTTSPDGLGGSTILADGVTILTSSTSMSFSVGAGMSVFYSGNTVRIMEPGSGAVQSFSGINTFTANTAVNRLVSASGSATQAFSGPGTLYVDSDARAFFTTSSAVSNLIDNTNNVPPQMVNIVARMDGNISLQIGGISFFDFASQDNLIDVGGGEGVSFIQRMVKVESARNIPGSSILTYFFEDDVLQVGDSNFTIQGFFLGDTSNGILMTIGTSSMFPGGGILYLAMGGAGAFYWPSDRVPTFRTVLDFLDGFDVSTIPMPITGIEMCAFYDGTRVRMFNVSALPLLPGPGLLGVSGNRCFFTNDQPLIQRIPETVSQLLPPSTIYNNISGVISVFSNTGELITSFSIGSRVLQAPGGLLEFERGNITIGNSVLAEDIDTLTVFDGFRVTVINAPDAAVLPGGGLLIIDEEAGTAFYTLNNFVANIITRAINRAVATFSPPSIPDSEPDELTSKLNEVNTGFGQLLTVYEGAEVNLRCNAGNANPPSMITFFMRSNFTENVPFTPVVNSSDIMIIVNGANDVTLNIPAISLGEVEFRCEASNQVGTASRTTRIRVRPPEPPVIDNSFFAGRASPGEQVITARTQGNVRTIIPIIAPAIEGMPEIDDPSQLTDRVSIGCKASGRPKPAIMWSVSEGGGLAVLVDTEGPDANVTSRRQGQSVLTVRLNSGDTACSVYSCIAANGAGMATGSAEVCPLQFSTETVTPMQIVSPCSATCGIGVERVDEAITISFNSTQRDATTADLPAGLVKPTVRFCQAAIRTCPETTFMFEVGNFSECSSFCAEGNQTRTVECMMMIDDGMGQVVNDSDCEDEGLKKPSEVVTCDSGPCPVYVDNGFGTCSSSCRGGMRERDLECLMPTMSSEGKFTFFPGIIVALETCFNYSMQLEPVLVEECNFNVPCPVRYFPGPFGECDEFSCQVRDVFCANYDPSDPLEAWPAGEAECIAQGLVRLSSVKNCNGRNCEFGRWNVTKEGCNAVCGIGEENQQVDCVNVTDSDPRTAVIEDGFCDVQLRPLDEVPCFVRNCPGECLFEPYVCPFLRKLRMCKTERLADLTQQCCISCPFQASPIPPLEIVGEVVPDEVTTMSDMTTGAAP